MTPENSITVAAGPRVYNLFPLLAGRVADWRDHLERIARMDFTCVYLNPFHYPGFSGSLYAIKDPYRLNDLFADSGAGDARSDEARSDDSLAGFVAAAKEFGLTVMMDVVVNHVSRDALLVRQHPDWCRREADGDLYSPRVADPADPSKITVWGDLCELDYDPPPVRDALVGYWSDYLRHYLALGFSEFRCDAAYKVPSEVWRRLIDAARAVMPGCRFFAETLGCTIPEIEAVAGAGFDFIFNSSKWWDFHSAWALDQYEQTRRIAPSVSFPESHDTPRLAAESGTDDPDRISRQLEFRYLFAAIFSTGVMMPMGYEFGAKRPLDVVRTRPADFEEARATGVDLSGFIAAANSMKAQIPALNQEGPMLRISAPGADFVALLRETPDRSDGCALVVFNPDPGRRLAADAGALLFETGGVYSAFRDVTPKTDPVPLRADRPLDLDPLQIRIFVGERTRPASRPVRDESARILELAANRVAIEAVWPEIDGGRHPVKRMVGDVLEIWADIFCDGHDSIAARILYRPGADGDWADAPMRLVDNDRWVGHVPLGLNGRYRYTIEAWRDLFASWRHDVTKKRDAGQDVALELAEGRALLTAARDAAKGAAKQALARHLAALDAGASAEAGTATLLSPELAADMVRLGPRGEITRYRNELEVVVDRTRAGFAAWYELFPRSMSGDPARHGTFDDVIRHLPRIRDMGFDVLYMPPIHPIGQTFRKGRNNTMGAKPGDPGSPYAIGSAEGGHTAIHAELGGFEAFHRLIAAARREGIEIALDFAIQCSPDHPWIRKHPEWFDWRPDGTIRYAENPPKKYQDIVNIQFYGAGLPAVWLALRDVVLFWIDQGISIFRVDNPHTKPLPFWEWLIASVQAVHPGTIFLAEAFTRPKMMKKLAKLGFTQSYSYFTWRHSKAEFTDYLTELTQDLPKEYFRPNFFVNTPDINPPFLQTGGRAGFQIRAVLAATLSALWGMYSGFELCEAAAIPGTEEYLDSEKYEIKARDWNRPGNIADFIARLNRARRDNPALHATGNLRFHVAHDDHLLFYGKATPARDNIVWIAVNLDPHGAHEADIELPLEDLAADENRDIVALELLSGEVLTWRGRTQRIRLDPAANPCAIWRVAAKRS